MKKEQSVVITRDNIAEFKGKTGVLIITCQNKKLKEFLTENVYTLYNALRLLSLNPDSTLPQNFKAVFVEKPIY